MSSPTQYQKSQEDFNPAFVLRPGVNASPWPDMKWQRAIDHLAELQSRFTQWSLSIPIVTESRLRDDRCTIDTFIKGIPSPAPLMEWSLLLGDFLHNLRSALDAMAWEFATFGGTEPRNSKAVQFPIALKAEVWEQALKSWVSDLPQPFIERLKVLQPYTFAIPDAISALGALHQLDIVDKHRSALTVSLTWDAVDVSGHFRMADPKADLDIRHEVPSGGGPIEVGALILTTHVGAEIEPNLHSYAPRPMPVLAVELNGAVQPIPGFASMLVAETRRYIDIMRAGLEDESLSEIPTGLAD